MTTSPLAKLLTSSGADAGDALSWLTHAVAGALSGVDYASISVQLKPGELRTVGATDPLAAKADALQYVLRCGPWAEVTTGAPVVQSADVRDDDRWPQYAARVAELGIRGQTTLRVSADVTSEVRALNLYSTSPGLLDSDQLAVAKGYAARAATDIRLGREMQSLGAAMRSHGLVNSAVGLVMQRYSLDRERAFRYLVQLSRISQAKLPHVARELIEQGS